jgi:hypothetical protein
MEKKPAAAGKSSFSIAAEFRRSIGAVNGRLSVIKGQEKVCQQFRRDTVDDGVRVASGQVSTLMTK